MKVSDLKKGDRVLNLFDQPHTVTRVTATDQFVDTHRIPGPTGSKPQVRVYEVVLRDSRGRRMLHLWHADREVRQP